MTRRLLVAGLLLLGLMACGNENNNNVLVQVPLHPVAIDVPSAVVTPGYTLNSSGPGFQVSEYSDGNFVLRSTTSMADVALLGSSHDVSPPQVRIVQGSYDVLYQHETGDLVPQNVDTPVQSNVVINSDQAPFAVSVTAWTVTPGFSHNGSAFPLTEYDDAVFYLRPRAGGELVFLGNSHTASPEGVLVMEGRYDVIYSLETGGDTVPNNQNAVVMSDVLINTDMPLDVEVVSERFQFSASLDDGPFPISQYQNAAFFLRNTAGDKVDLAYSNELAVPVAVMVVSGSYDIVYQHLQGDAVPNNSHAVIMNSVLIDASNQSQIAAINSVLVTPIFSLDGGSFPQSEYQDANFFLRNASNHDDELLLGASHFASPVAVRAISSLEVGNYDVLYRVEDGTEVPQNTNAVVQTNITLDADVVLPVPVMSIEVTGQFTLNGNSFPGGVGNSVRFMLRGDDDEDVFLLGYSDINNEPVKLVSISGASGYETYDVIMDHVEGIEVPQNVMHIVDFDEVLSVNDVYGVDITARRVLPEFTLDGLAFPASIYQSATFYLRDRTTNQRIYLGRSDKNNSAVMLIKEDYDIIYEHLNGDLVPQNSYSVLGILDL
ncbi:MAG: hypothetical protein COB30_010935 [Ectothiorhodospiraceae bacterium]|nr:hypothetical protein [Ectothiorhodospiraceae bacterium]